MHLKWGVYLWWQDSDFVSSLPSGGDHRQHKANPCNTAVSPPSTVTWCILITSPVNTPWSNVLCGFPLQIFGICLAQNLVSDVKAVKANWWQERWYEEAPPHEPSKVTTAQEQSCPAEGGELKNIQLCLLCHRAKQHIHTLTLVHVQTQRVYVPVYLQYLMGEKNIPHKPNSQHFVYHSAGILTQIYRGRSCLLKI